jgi:hypothetical protein
MLGMINARRAAEKKEERYDLFSSLLAAADDPEDRNTITDRELIGVSNLEVIASEAHLYLRKHLHFSARWWVIFLKLLTRD